MKPEKTLRARALDLLGRGEYSRWQLKQKLSKYSEDEQEIDALLDDLSERGWQSDQRFAEVFIHSKAPRLGKLRLQQQLQQKGVDSDLFQDALPDKTQEIATATEVLTKKFKLYQTDVAMKAKYMRFLAYRGFEMDVIHSALRAFQEAADAE